MTTARRITAIDIGSDTVHMLIARVEESPDGPSVTPITSRGQLLELGRLVATKGHIGRRAGSELLTLLRSYVSTAARKSDSVAIGATEALRRATDGPALVEHLSSELKVPVHLLSGQREAALGLTGARPRLDPEGSQLLIDSGGASTELTLTSGRQPLKARSLPIGAALIGANLKGDPPQALSWALAAASIGAVVSSSPKGAPGRAWATGGSAHNLAGLERTKDRTGDQVLTVRALSNLASQLLAEPARRLARRTGEDPARVALLPSGLLIMAAVLAHYDLDKVTVVPEGLREGIAAAAFVEADTWWKDEKRAQSGGS